MAVRAGGCPVRDSRNIHLLSLHLILNGLQSNLSVWSWPFPSGLYLVETAVLKPARCLASNEKKVGTDSSSVTHLWVGRQVCSSISALLSFSRERKQFALALFTTTHAGCLVIRFSAPHLARGHLDRVMALFMLKVVIGRADSCTSLLRIQLIQGQCSPCQRRALR
jgi:hypothetical protein